MSTETGQLSLSQPFFEQGPADGGAAPGDNRMGGWDPKQIDGNFSG